MFRLVCISLLFCLTVQWQAVAADVDFHIVGAKGQNLMQTNAAGPLVAATNEPPFIFLSLVALTSPGSVTNVILRTPASTFPLLYSAEDFQYGTNAGFASKTALDSAFPNGIYTQSIYAVSDGTKHVRLTLPVDLYPNDPAISNWSAAQSVNMTEPFTLRWATFVGGTVNDYIRLEIEDSNWNQVLVSGDPGQAGAIVGTNTSYFIPAGTFRPDTLYHAMLLFVRITGATNAFPSAYGVTGFLKQNNFNLHTLPQPNLVFFDGFQQLPPNTNVTSGALSYTPIVGSNTIVHLAEGAPTVTITNIQQNLWAHLDCSGPPNNVVLKCIPTMPLTNRIIEVRWLLWIQATNDGFGAFSVNLPFAPNEYNPPLVLLDSGQIAAFTNTPSPFNAIPIGTWGHLAGTVMTNSLTLNFPSRTLSYSLNGQLITNITLGAYWTNLVDAVCFAVNEDFPESTGNRFRLDNIRIEAFAYTPPDVSDYVLAKGAFYMQTNTAAPVFRDDAPFAFLAQVMESGSGTVTSASIQLPGGSSQALTEDPDDNLYEIKALFASTNTLDTAYPNGTYTFTIVGVHDSTNRPVLSLTGNLYPNAPYISNWTAAQHIVATNDFTLTWNAFSGGTTGDFVQVNIEDNSGNILFTTPSPGEPDALNGTHTSVLIPANTLAPGTPYQGQVLFAKVISVNSTGYPNVNGFSAYFSQTDFQMKTADQDSVGDGIPDWWRALYFGGDGTTTNSFSCATADPDGDGMSNFAEYLAGTVPTSGASSLRITNVARENHDMRITWAVVTGKTYIVQTSTNLLTDSFDHPANQVTTIFVPYSPPITLTNVVHLGAVTNVPARFYRIRLHIP